jgi:hypothetical protein
MQPHLILTGEGEASLSDAPEEVHTLVTNIRLGCTSIKAYSTDIEITHRLIHKVIWLS